jgi:hypothetical protein
MSDHTARNETADALENFADFILAPKHPGLCEYTLIQVAAEARNKANELRDLPNMRDAK